MINECLFLPEFSEHCPISQNKHQRKMKLKSIPVLLRQSSNYCFILFLRTGNTKLTEKSKRRPRLRTLKAVASRWNSCLLHRAVTFRHGLSFARPSAEAEPEAASVLSPKLRNPNHKADLRLASESLLPGKFCFFFPQPMIWDKTVFLRLSCSYMRLGYQVPVSRT